MIYKELSNNEFIDAFRQFGRGNQYTMDGFDIIYDYLNESEDDIKLDVIGIASDIREGSFVEIVNDYGIDFDDLGLDVKELLLESDIEITIEDLIKQFDEIEILNELSNVNEDYVIFNENTEEFEVLVPYNTNVKDLLWDIDGAFTEEYADSMDFDLEYAINSDLIRDIDELLEGYLQNYTSVLGATDTTIVFFSY